MTRNEMVEQLSKFLNTLECVNTSSGIKADSILEFLESKGMLPPKIFFHATGEYESAKKVLDDVLEDYEASIQWENDYE